MGLVNIYFDTKLNPPTSFDVPPRGLSVPCLPYPPFYTYPPASYFWHQGQTLPEDIYASECLMIENQKEKCKKLENSEALLMRAAPFLPNTAILRQASDRFVYLEISEECVHALLPLLGKQLVRLSHQREPNFPKAHIAVLLPKEVASKAGWTEIKELGTEFSFTIKHCYALEPALWPEIETVYFLTVESKELEALRERYLLPSKINAQEFKLVIGTKEAKSPRYEEKQGPYRLNISCHLV